MHLACSSYVPSVLSPDAETSSFILRSYWQKPWKRVQGQVRNIVSTYLTTQTNVGSPEHFMFLKEKLQKLSNKNSYILHLDAPDVNIGLICFLTLCFHIFTVAEPLEQKLWILLFMSSPSLTWNWFPKRLKKKKKKFWSFQQHVKLLHSTFQTAGRRSLYNGAFWFKAWPCPLIYPKKKSLNLSQTLRLHLLPAVIISISLGCNEDSVKQHGKCFINYMFSMWARILLFTVPME